ncbi:uncharacterized protein LOC122506359 [Leptopilina heterotoma]|uniref:uncharacterized protein LOC122506359 n=1 Tax=Leptopilina heterotoma TaxID=63436 RepID=UPI001CA91CEF|nr:uncharacterized protein LOC122506359 [Leptopilina heterotoma]
MIIFYFDIFKKKKNTFDFSHNVFFMKGKFNCYLYKMDKLKCEMCFYKGLSQTLLRKHILNCHRHNPLFKITCQCGETYRNYETFRKHNYRTHNATFDKEENEPFHFPTAAFNDISDNVQKSQQFEAPVTEEVQNKKALLKVKLRAAQFLLNIRENGKTSQSTIEEIVTEIITLYNSYSDDLLKEIEKHVDPETNLVNSNIIKRLIAQNSQNYSESFSDFASKNKLDQFLVEEFKMVQPVEMKMGTTLRWVKKDSHSDLIERKDNAYIVPVLDTLKNLLSNDEIRENIENRIEKDDGTYRSVLDGEIYKENPFFRENPNALAILFYYDDLTVTNPLGANCKKHNLSMFYWSPGNIEPRLRSNKNSIYLYSIVKTNFLKKYGIQKFLEPLVKEMNILQTEGLRISVGNEIKIFKGSILFSSGDNPASAFLGGYKRSVSAHCLCRTCMATESTWKEKFNESEFTLRNVETHNHHLRAINEENITKNEKNKRKVEFGINERSPLLDINNLDVTKCLPQDGMHVLIEGVCIVETQCLLHYLIFDKGLFTLDDLNESIENFNFDYFGVNKPALILMEHLSQEKSLKQSASQMLGLVFTLPFLIVKWLKNDDTLESMYCHTLLLQIVSTCFAYEISSETVHLLERMIEVFILRFIRLYPNEIVPKFHFLIHIPMYIRLFGPARQQWCFRFESQHSYFKSMMPVIRSFKNAPLSLSYRFQSKIALELATGSENKTFLYKGDEISPGEILLLQNLPNAHLFKSYLEKINCLLSLQIMRSPKIKSYGATYKQNSIFLLDCEDETLPTFAKIKDIYIIKEKIMFLFKVLETVEYDRILNAYCVAEPINTNEDVILLENLIFPHSIPTFSHDDKTYVTLLFHERTEFIG